MGHHLDPGHQQRTQGTRRLQGFAQHSIYSKPYQQAILERLDMDVRGIFLDRLGQQGVDQADDRCVIGAFQQIFRLRQTQRHLIEINIFTKILHHPRRAVAVALIAVLQQTLELLCWN